MDTFTLVRPEHLNHHGYLFGGCMLRWVDEFAWLAASREFRGCSFVTVALDKVVFEQRVLNGSILRFSIVLARRGTTSVAYAVKVFADAPGATREKEVFKTKVTLVNLNATGKPQALPPAPRPRR